MRVISRFVSEAPDEPEPYDHRVKMFKELARLDGSGVSTRDRERPSPSHRRPLAVVRVGLPVAKE
jgi:hypothetical protein